MKLFSPAQSLQSNASNTSNQKPVMPNHKMTQKFGADPNQRDYNRYLNGQMSYEQYLSGFSTPFSTYQSRHPTASALVHVPTNSAPPTFPSFNSADRPNNDTYLGSVPQQQPPPPQQPSQRYSVGRPAYGTRGYSEELTGPPPLSHTSTPRHTPHRSRTIATPTSHQQQEPPSSSLQRRHTDDTHDRSRPLNRQKSKARRTSLSPLSEDSRSPSPRRGSKKNILSEAADYLLDDNPLYRKVDKWMGRPPVKK